MYEYMYIYAYNVPVRIVYYNESYTHETTVSTTGNNYTNHF